MQKRFFLLFFMFFGSHQSGAMFIQNVAQQKILMQKYTESLQKQKICRIPEKIPRGLLIFLDESEGNSLGFNSIKLLTALAQKAGPILTSTSLLYSFFQYNGKVPSRAEVKEFFAKEDENKKKYFAWNAADVDFNEKEWIIKQIDPYLSFLVPYKYLKQCGIGIDQARRDGVTVDTVSKTELKLGLKINHMKTVLMQDVETQSGGVIEKYFINNLKNIFCLKNEYYTYYKRKQKQLSYPLWTFYLTGHGSVGIIAGMSLKEFNRILNFFDSSICTKLLVYSSCYAGSQNDAQFYKSGQSSMAYSFSIVVEGLTDTSVYTDINFTGHKCVRFSIILPCFFNYFLEKVMDDKTVSLSYCIANIKSYHIKNISNALKIKPAGLEWFTPIDMLEMFDAMISIDSILAKSGRKKVDVVTFFKHKKYIKTILLYAHYIPFELVVPESITNIVSMVPGSVIHSIEAISAKNNGCLCVERWFEIFNDGMLRKIFFIKKLTDAEKNWKDVVVYNDDNKVNILYTSNDKRYSRYKKDGQFIDKLCDKQKNNKYNNLLRTVNSFDEQHEISNFQDGIKNSFNYFFFFGFLFVHTEIYKAITFLAKIF